MSTLSPYFSYLLRLWLAGDGDQTQWRTSLDDPVTGERVGFGSLEEMFAYLKKKTLADVAQPQSSTKHHTS
jgi:hypothetical protein